MQGKTINGYTLQRQLGKGGMAEVWLAENAIGKKAAVKLLLPKFCNDETVVARFQNEANVMVQLDHPNIRQVYDLGDIDGRPCIVMEYLEGNDLKVLMKSGERFTDENLQKWWDQMVDALNYTHDKGIVHRDIKPSNIFLDRNGNIKLADFGIAKIKESISMTQTGATMGTLMYMSPEQVQDSKHIGPQSDTYSLAVTFVHLLTGKAPYDTTSSNDYVIRKGIVEQELDLSVLSSPWRVFLKPYLAKDPADRPALRAFSVVHETPQNPTIDEDEGTIVEDSPASEEDENTIIESPCNGALSKNNHQDGSSISETEQPSLVLQPTQPAKKKRKRHTWIIPVALVGGIMIISITIAMVYFVEEHVGNFDNNTLIVTESGDLAFTVKGVSFVMKRVEGGSFLMGSDSISYVWEKTGTLSMSTVPVDKDKDDTKPVHSVTLSTYYIGETEVTQALWNKLMRDNPSGQEGDNYPVYKVSWNECQKFISKLNRLTGKNFRLPTEAEWEFAARGGNQSNGYIYAGSDDYDKVAGGYHVVKTKQPNELGIYDMSGNVDEWCSDWYASNYYSYSPSNNPQGPSSGTFRVKRGGDRFLIAPWVSGQVTHRSKAIPELERSYIVSMDGYEGTGFRLVLSQ